MRNKTLFPLTSRKTPAVPKDTDWREYKGPVNSQLYGIAIPEGFIIFDLDTYKGVTTSQVDELFGCELPWDVALAQGTLNGGEHYGFEVPEGISLTNGANVLGLKGFDTRSAGKGYIATGTGYTDATWMGLVDAIHSGDYFPKLPEKALQKLKTGESTPVIIEGELVDDFDFSLDKALSEQPLEGISLEKAKLYVGKLPTGDLEDHDHWLKPGFALHHQFDGSDEALNVWIDWSRASSSFDEGECRDRWPTFAKRDGINKPTRFDYIIFRAGGKDSIANALFEQLTDEAKHISELKDYQNFKDKVSSYDKGTLGNDLRTMIAHELHTAYGAKNGLTKTDLRKELVFKPSREIVKTKEQPSWMKGWCYVEKTCEFSNHILGYHIKREAFNAKYDREFECMGNPQNESPMQASALSLITYNIRTVVDTMYWPSADKFFTYDGMDMLNTYQHSGVKPWDELGDEGQEIVDRFLKHIDISIECREERTILLDFMTWVYCNPGDKVNWALFMQGAEGTGKSYFSNIMQNLLSTNANNIDTTAIEGRFNGFAHGTILGIIEEIRVSGANRWQIMDRLKQYISNKTIVIEEKGRDHRTVPNFTSYMLYSNHKDALPIGADDRRYAVIFGRFQSQKQMFKHFGGSEQTAKYFDDLFDGIEGERSGAIARFLLDRKISEDFKPKSRAPHTKSKERMIRLSQSEEGNNLDKYLDEFRCATINENMLDITYFRQLVDAEYGKDALPSQNIQTTMLKEKGYEPISKRRVKVKVVSGGSTGYKQHYLWVVEGFDEDEAIATVRSFMSGEDEGADLIPF